jgi:hypothetical protein
MTNTNTTAVETFFFSEEQYLHLLDADGSAWRLADSTADSVSHHLGIIIDEVVHQVCDCGIDHDLEGDEEGLFWH